MNDVSPPSPKPNCVAFKGLKIILPTYFIVVEFGRFQLKQIFYVAHFKATDVGRVVWDTLYRLLYGLYFGQVRVIDTCLI